MEQPKLKLKETNPENMNFQTEDHCDANFSPFLNLSVYKKS